MLSKPQAGLEALHHDDRPGRLPDHSMGHPEELVIVEVVVERHEVPEYRADDLVQVDLVLGELPLVEWAAYEASEVPVQVPHRPRHAAVDDVCADLVLLHGRLSEACLHQVHGTPPERSEGPVRQRERSLEAVAADERLSARSLELHPLEQPLDELLRDTDLEQ